MDTQSPSDVQNTSFSWDNVFESDAPPRLGIPVDQRLKYVFLSAASAGFTIGAMHGNTMAGYRFRAENAHRYPTTSLGWIQYHKLKQSMSMVGVMKEGPKLGLKLGACAFAFSLFEETVDYARHDRRDFLSTVTAGLTASGLYSLMARHDVYTAARTTKRSLKMSLMYGLGQDAVACLKGETPAFVDFLLGNRHSNDE